MTKFEKILICLDLTEMDYFLINYSNYLIKTFSPKKLVFIHVMETYDLPDEITDALDESGGNLEEIVSSELEERINMGLSVKSETDVTFTVETGLTTEKLLHYTRKNKFDLAVFGKKIGYSGQGSVARKVVGMLPSSVLVISETSRNDFKKILVRMDFSSMSASTLMMAQSIANYTGANIECHHVYKLPLNYYSRQTPENLKKMKNQLTHVVIKEYEKFNRKNKITNPPPLTYSLDVKADEAQLLYNHAIKNSFDLIITGTKIKSPLASLILDSTSEKLVGGDKSLPVMVVKDHKKSVGILKAIFD